MAALATLKPRRGAAWRGGLLAGSMIVPLLLSPALAQEAASNPAPLSDGGSAIPALPGPADTVLPRTGLDPTLSDLREHLLESYGDMPPPAAPASPAWHINTQLGVSEEFTSNVGQNGSGGRGYDFITMIQPGIVFADTTQRLQVNLNYAPIGQIYARNGDYSQFEQQFNGSVLVTALPGWLYVDMRGAVSQQAVFGGLGPASTAALSPDNRETVSSVSVSPYLSRPLGTAGTVDLGAGYTYSASDSSAPQSATNPLLDGIGAYGDSYLATKRVFASFTTGEELGRLRDKIGTDDSFYDGDGALAGGRRLLVTDDVSYALTRSVTLLGEAGYEDLSYPASDFFYSGPVGSGGVRLTSGKASTVTLEYRYIDGFGSAFVQGSVQATARIRLFGGYSAGISTFQQDVQDSLLDSDDTTTGVYASALQAAPLLGGGNAFGANQNLNRTHRLDASASYLGSRDIVTLSVQRETTEPVGREVEGFPPVSTSGFFGSVSETHDFWPVTSLTAFVQYGINRDGIGDAGTGNANGDTVSFSVSLNRALSDTLNVYARVGGTYVVAGSGFADAGYQGLSGNDTTVTVGAVKRF